MDEPRIGRQTPTRSVSIPYENTCGQEAIDRYNSTGRTAQPWQELLIYDILAVNDDGLWVHSKFGYAVPRRNGKNEIVSIRELYGLNHGERMLHTAHRTTTSAAAARRLAALLDGAGYIEVTRVRKDEAYDKHYTFTKQLGLECITLLGEGGGSCSFRTRSSKGGLGEGFDLLVIDEAQEYQDSEESALKYVVSDSPNPQTLFCGTPPTAVSSGTVFMKLRDAALQGESVDTGWAEWSVERQTDPHDREAWYETNPSLGTILTERKILAEIGTDDVDFNIQRLGLWLRYNQKSAISKAEWDELRLDRLPALTGGLCVGIKYGRDGEGVAMAIAVRTKDGSILVEAIDHRPVRDGDGWLLDFLARADPAAVVVDGANGQRLLADAMKQRRLKAPMLPSVAQIVLANAAFQSALFARSIRHMGQPSVSQIVSNCEKRAIGSNGGFGYRSIMEGAAIELLDAVILAHWACSEQKERRKQTVRC